MATQQEQIIRQSQIKLALDYYNTCGFCSSIVDLVKTTTMLEQYIKEGYSSDLINKIEKLDQYIQENYKV